MAPTFPATSPPMPPADRLVFLDNLRVAALGLLIVYHVGMYYVTWGWHVKSPHASPALEPLMALSAPWRMSLLFVLSGAVTSPILARHEPRHAGGWLGARLKRLGLPLLAGVFVLVPPQSYFEVVQKTGFDGSYLAFLRLYLGGHRGFCDAQGCLIVPTWNHLWFLPYLMLYTALLWASLRRAPGWLDAAARRLETQPLAWGLIGLPLAALVAVRWLLRPWFDVTHALVDDPLAHAQFGLAFVVGAVWARSPGTWGALQRLRWPALTAAGLAWALLQFGGTAPFPLGRAAYATQQWCGVVAAIGFAHRHLRGQGAAWRQASTLVFPVYVLHQTLTIAWAVALRPLHWPPALEGPALVGLTLASALALAWPLQRWPALAPWLGAPATPPRAAPRADAGSGVV